MPINRGLVLIGEPCTHTSEYHAALSEDKVDAYVLINTLIFEVKERCFARYSIVCYDIYNRKKGLRKICLFLILFKYNYSRHMNSTTCAYMHELLLEEYKGCL